MGLQRPEKNAGVAGGLGDFERVFVGGAGGEAEAQLEFADDEVNGFEPPGELFHEPAQNEQKRFNGFDFVLDIDLLYVMSGRRDKFQWTHRSR